VKGARAALATWLLLTVCACNPQAPKSAASPSPAPAANATSPSLHITGQGTAAHPVRIIQQRHNRVMYELIASSLDSKGRQGHTRTVFKNARITFHDRSGGTMTAQAPQAVVDENANVVTLLGGVRARTASGMTLQCKTLVYDRATEMLHGKDDVVVIDPNGFRGTGSSFDSNIALTAVRML
jgi:LPS export ABC transporter protein LptC